MLRLSSILVFVSLTSTVGLSHAGTVRQAEGSSAVVVEGVSSDAESKVGETLPEGAVITTGNDGRIVIEVAPGILLELQPDAQVTIGAMDPDAGIDSTGGSIPRISVNLVSGALVVHATTESLNATSVLVVTPKGSFSPASSGATLVSAVSPTSPDGSVTVAAVTGSGIVTTTEGDELTLGDGMIVVLGSTAPAGAATISDSPQASQITEVGQSSVSRISSLPANPVGSVTTTAAPAARSVLVPTSTGIVTTAAPTPTPLPPRPTPTPTPTPSPSPTPLPPPTTPAPSPTPTPSPTPSPTPTPTPSPSPSPTPLPPRPTPTPTPSPSPSPTPLPPRPTPSPTPTPISP